MNRSVADQRINGPMDSYRYSTRRSEAGMSKRVANGVGKGVAKKVANGVGKGAAKGVAKGVA